MPGVVEINGVKFDLAFNRAALKHLGKAWDCSGTAAVINKLASLFHEGGNEEMTFEQEDSILEMVKACMVGGGSPLSKIPSDDDLFKHVLSGGFVEELLEIISESLPKVSDESQGQDTDEKKK